MSPAKDALALAVPALLLLPYDTVNAWLNPPPLVTMAVQGVNAAPEKMEPEIQLIVTVDADYEIVADPLTGVIV